DITAELVKTIHETQEEGPYFLGGWCTAGLVAYEVAQQLRAKGQTVALLVLFDVVNRACFKKASRLEAVRAQIYFLAEKLRYHFAQSRRLGRKAGRAYILDKLATILLNLGRRLWRLSHKLHQGLGRQLDGWPLDREEALFYATRSFRPQPYS